MWAVAPAVIGGALGVTADHGLGKRLLQRLNILRGQGAARQPKPIQLLQLKQGVLVVGIGKAQVQILQTGAVGQRCVVRDFGHKQLQKFQLHQRTDGCG